MSELLKAPFPYFGGKSRIADEVWKRLGDTPNYVEPFFGSGAVLLARPADHVGKIETVNDADGMVANFWRALQSDPDAVARHAAWPVNENDLMARHIWLVKHKTEIGEQLMADPDWYDVKAAGWWCWGICCWIGSGWCSGDGPWTSEDGHLVHLGNGRGVNRKRVHLGNAGQGVNRQLVHLGDAGRGVNRKLVHLNHQGQGIHQVSNDDSGIYEWFAALSERLRRVRVCCGDWSRVCGPTPTVAQGLTAVFLDPPYGEGRTAELYATDSLDVAEEVRRWAIERGDDPRMRITLCGYDDLTMPEGWEMLRWKAHGGYRNQGEGAGRENARREVVWFSPHCIPDIPMPTLFDLIGAN